MLDKGGHNGRGYPSGWGGAAIGASRRTPNRVPPAPAVAGAGKQPHKRRGVPDGRTRPRRQSPLDGHRADRLNRLNRPNRPNRADRLNRATARTARLAFGELGHAALEHRDHVGAARVALFVVDELGELLRGQVPEPGTQRRDR
jgi:hypothetical protein